MTQDLSDFEEQLGKELRAAAYRRVEARGSRTPARRSSPRLYPVLIGALATVDVVAIAAFVLAEIRPRPVAAHPFSIVYLEHEIHLEIVDLVSDPRAAERELRGELGIDVTLETVPAPPELLNQVSGSFSTGSTNIEVEFDAAGRSKTIILPQRIDGEFVIQYGRTALPGERYIYSITSPICAEVWAQTPTESAQRIPQLADTIGYDTFDSDYNYYSEVPFTDIDRTYRLIDTMFWSDTELLVVYSAHLDALGTDRPNSGWSEP